MPEPATVGSQVACPKQLFISSLSFLSYTVRSLHTVPVCTVGLE